MKRLPQSQALVRITNTRVSSFKERHAESNESRKKMALNLCKKVFLAEFAPEI